MIEPTCTKLSKWKQIGNEVRFIRCDNAGKNKKLEEALNGSKWKITVQFEHTARATLQHNHLVEVGFSTIFNKGRALLITANTPAKMRHKLFPMVSGNETR